MVLLSCHLKTTNGPKYVPEAISQVLKFKIILGGGGEGGGCPQTPLQGVLPHAIPLPPKFSTSIILPPPLSIFLNETLPIVPKIQISNQKLC